MVRRSADAEPGDIAVAVLKMLFRLFLLVLFLSPAIMPLLTLQREPLVLESEGAIFDDIDEAKQVLKRFDPRLMASTQPTKVTVTASEISRAVSAAFSRFSRVRSRVEALPDAVWIGGTVELPIPDTFLGRYLNVEAVIAESEKELEVSSLSIGSLPIPSWSIKPATIFALDWFMGDGKGEPTYASIRSVQVDGQQITVAFQPPAGLVADMKAAAGKAIHLGNKEAIRAYYRTLTQVSLISRGTVSLADYMGPLFTVAAQRSRDNSPVEENRAAILALAIYFGDSRFELLMRDVGTADFNDGGFDTEQVHLEQRHDWVQHFVTTAAIQVAAGSGISNFIGEAKEIDDADGPSGFSFTDLAADRAGVRFAEVATRSAASARRLQQVIAAGAREADFFPRVGDLPEGLSESDFKAAYGDLDTPRYNALVAKIDRRIAAIALYE
jgi:hypothetical protein